MRHPESVRKQKVPIERTVRFDSAKTSSKQLCKLVFHLKTKKKEKNSGRLFVFFFSVI